MKYKNIELSIGGTYCSTDELSCCVEFENSNQDYIDSVIEEMEKMLEEIFADFEYIVFSEVINDNFILVKCDDITFDEKGVSILEKIYNSLVSKTDAKITVNVYVADRDDRNVKFKRKDGRECNDEDCSFEEFIQNIEY